MIPHLLENEELKKKFASKNQDIAAAMLAATKQAADNGIVLSETDPKKNKRASQLIAGLFATALADIKAG